MQTWDLLVLGGGPAGASAALVAGGNGLRTCLVEARSELGGQLHWADAPIQDLLGQPSASGPRLARGFGPQLEAVGVEVKLNTRVVALDRAPGGFLAGLSTGESCLARRVLIATGLRRRTLGIPGEELAEHSLSPRRDAAAFAGREVLVVGGGDEAADTARGLAAAGARVTLVVRSSLRARPLFKEALLAQSGVTLRVGAGVLRMSRSASGTLTVGLEDGSALTASACFIRIGAEPELPHTGFELERHEDGRLVVGAGGATSEPGVYAAGDVVHDRGERYVSMAMGSGTVAARAIEASLTGPEAGREA